MTSPKSTQLRKTSSTIPLNGENCPIYEAPADIFVNVTVEDVDKAVPGDPCRCAFANAAKRLYNCDYVDFHRSVAYLHFRKEYNKRFKLKENAFFRYLIPHAERESINALDRGQDFPPGNYLLRAPTEGRTVDAMRKNNRRIAARQHSISNENDGKRRRRSPRGEGLPRTLVSEISA